jgi:hypothetical protein
MFTFNVVREPHGWAVRMGEPMTMPFRSREVAVQAANRLAGALRGHGESTEVIVDAADSTRALPESEPPGLVPAYALSSGYWSGSQ